MPKVSINSSTITQFGFKITFDLVSNLLRLNITDLTTFTNNGENTNQGIFFEVISPSDSYISTIDYNTKAIDTSASGVEYTIPLPNVDRFGFYSIIGEIKDADGVVTRLMVPTKEFCAIGETDNEGNVISTLGHSFNPISNKLKFFLGTPLKYKNTDPTLKENLYTLIFPDAATSPINNITSIPISVTAPTTGKYVFKGKTIATFLYDDTYIRIPYSGRHEAEVSGTNQLESLVCCLKDIQDEASDCTTAKGKDAHNKYKSVEGDVIIALLKDRSGVDVSELVSEIKKKLGCDCKCDNVKSLSPQPITNGNGLDFVFEAECDATVEQDINGNTVTIKIGAVKREVLNSDIAEDIVFIQTIESDCGVQYVLTLDRDKLFEFIRNGLTSDNEFSEWLKSFIKNNQPKPNVDLKCLTEDGKEKNYHAELCAHATSGSSLKWKRIQINNSWHDAPVNLDTSNVSSATTWLNGLSLGTFSVTAKSGCTCAGYFASVVGGYQISVDSDNNTNAVQVIEVTANDDGQLYVVPVDSTVTINTAKTIDEVLQLIIDWACNFCLCDMEICADYTVSDSTCSEIIEYDCNCEIILATSDTIVGIDGYKYGGVINPNFKLLNGVLQLSSLPTGVGWLYNSNQFKFKVPCGTYNISVESNSSSALCDPLIYTVTEIGDTTIKIVISNLSIGDTYDYSVDGGATWQTNASATTFTIISLSPGTSYNLQLRRHCSNGGTSISALTQVTTNNAVCNIPVFTIDNITSNSFVINITNFQSNTGYDVSLDGGVSYTLSSLNNNILVSGLISANAYNVIVRHRCEGTPLSAPMDINTLEKTYTISLQKVYSNGGNGSTTGEFLVTVTLKDSNGDIAVADSNIDYTFDQTLNGEVLANHTGTITAGASTDVMNVNINNPAEQFTYNACLNADCGAIENPCWLGLPTSPCDNCLSVTLGSSEVTITLKDCCGNNVEATDNILVVFEIDCGTPGEQYTLTIESGTSEGSLSLPCALTGFDPISNTANLQMCLP